MAITTETRPFFCFSWDGYHHHLGVNTLEGPGPEPVSPEVAGLDAFTRSRSAAVPRSRGT